MKKWMKFSLTAILAGSMAFATISPMAAPADETAELPQETFQVTQEADPEDVPPGAEDTDDPEEDLTTQADEPKEDGTLPEETTQEDTGLPEETTPAETTAVEEGEAAQPALEAPTGPVADLVKRYYVNFLNRDPEEDGWAKWVAQIEAKTITACQLAANILFSPEALSKNKSDGEFISDLYLSCLNRAPSASEIENWQKVLDKGFTRKKVAEGILNSQEFANMSAVLGVPVGTFFSTDYLDTHAQVTEFVSRFYTIILGRKPERKGQENWVRQLVESTKTGAEVAYGFLFSPEYVKKNKSDSDYVEDLYQGLFGRASDAPGKNTWLTKLSNLMSRTWVLQGFIGSKEFSNLCNKYGITPGSIKVTEARDKYPGITELVVSLYRNCLKRTTISPGEVNKWVASIAEDGSCLDAVSGFFNSQEYKNKGTSNAQFVKDVYKSLLFREADASGLSTWTSKLNNGTDRAELLESILFSAEFQNLCKKKSIPLITSGWYKDRYYENGKKYTGWKWIDDYKRYFKDGELLTDLDEILGNTHNYRIRLNNQKCVVTAYAYDSETGAYDIPCKVSLCTTGADGTETTLGNFAISDQYRWHTLMGPCYGQWCSRFNGGMLFHSIMYNVYGDNRTLMVGAYNNLGNRGSHGCCRLPAYMAKWIYDHCSYGTRVTVYNSSDPGPLGKPAADWIPGSHTWDPTDPTARQYCIANGCH